MDNLFFFNEDAKQNKCCSLNDASSQTIFLDLDKSAVYWTNGYVIPRESSIRCPEMIVQSIIGHFLN